VETGYDLLMIEAGLENYVEPWMGWMIYYLFVEHVFSVFIDADYLMTYLFTPERYFQEMKGIVDGSGGEVTWSHIRRLNLYAELSRAHCTILGAWGTATADGKLYHLRTLDWNPSAPVNEYPSIVIYEPTEPGSQTFANIGYLGLIGSLTALNKAGISVGEKVMYRKSNINYDIEPKWSYFGKPWMYVLRDTIQFATSMHDVERMLIDT
jgi:hypothetical protein